MNDILKKWDRIKSYIPTKFQLRNFKLAILNDYQCQRYYRIIYGVEPTQYDIERCAEYIFYCGYRGIESARRFFKNCAIENVSVITIDTNAGMSWYEPYDIRNRFVVDERV